LQFRFNKNCDSNPTERQKVTGRAAGGSRTATASSGLFSSRVSRLTANQPRHESRCGLINLGIPGMVVFHLLLLLAYGRIGAGSEGVNELGTEATRLQQPL